MAARRLFTPAFKARVVLEELTGIKSAAELCREHQLKPQLLAHWKAQLVERAPELFGSTPNGSDAQERIAALERMVGRLPLEVEVAKKASQLATSRVRRNGR
jgi:transposase-like protein